MYMNINETRDEKLAFQRKNENLDIFP